MQDAAVLRQRAKVTYTPDDSLAALLPARVAVVEITLNDGTRLSERVEAVRGTVRNPMPRDRGRRQGSRPGGPGARGRDRAEADRHACWRSKLSKTCGR